MLGKRVVCPIGPANQRIILQIDGFLVDGLNFSTERCVAVEDTVEET